MRTPAPLSEFPLLATSVERDRWVLARRGPRNLVSSSRPYAMLLEIERSEDALRVETVTVFLTNRECPWRCVMCDLWKNTLETQTPVGAIPLQITVALRELGSLATPSPQRQIKLYNSGSFFDPGAIPIEDYPEVAHRIVGFGRLIVESHPSLVGDRVIRLQEELGLASRRMDQPAPRLEVAVGLETVHPDALRKLNKRMTVDDFRRAAQFLADHQVSLRVFLLVQPPFLEEAEGAEWLRRSMVEAFDAGATVVSLIPTRLGNGALESLAAQGGFREPQLEALESALASGLRMRRGRVFADLWDLKRFSRCDHCFEERLHRLESMNDLQEILDAVRCAYCDQNKSARDLS